MVVDQGPEFSPIAQLAIEVWRLGLRLDQSEISPERLTDSLRRLTSALDRAGVRFHDPVGERYFEGMNAEVIGLGDRTDSGLDSLAITQVLRPAVFVNGVCLIAPQIVVGQGQIGEVV